MKRMMAMILGIFGASLVIGILGATPVWGQAGCPALHSFATSATLNMGYGPQGIASGDFNNDGKTDLVTANFDDPYGVSVAFGDGVGGFSTPTDFWAPGFDAFAVTTGDFNADGNLDIAAAVQTVGGYKGVAILLGDGTGNFPDVREFGNNQGPQYIATGDFNSDGKLDIAATLLDSVMILIGDGSGS